MRIPQTLIVFLFISSSLFAHDNFKIDTIYQYGNKITKVTTSGDGDIWFTQQDGSAETYKRLVIKQGVEDYTSLFESLFPSSITDYVSVGFNKLLVGTSNDYAFIYENGVTVQIDTGYGIDDGDRVVNSVFYKKEESEYGCDYSMSEKFAFSTNGYLYSSEVDTGAYEKYYDYQNVKLISKDEEFFFIFLDDPSDVLYASKRGKYTFDDFGYSNYGNVLSANATFWSSSYVNDIWVGTEKGFVNKQHLWTRYLTNFAIYAMVDFNDNQLLATSDGLYSRYQKIHFGDTSYVAYDAIEYKGAAYVASSIGLLKVIVDSCPVSHVIPDIFQDKEYLRINTDDSVTLSHDFINGCEKFQWDLGDGITSNSQTVKHKYAQTGNYTVKLKLSSSACEFNDSTIVVVYDSSKYQPAGFTQNFNGPFSGESTASGALFFIDIDNDNDQDILLPYRGFYKNSGDVEFEEISSSHKEHFNLCCDLDNDGYVDLIGKNNLYINNGDGSFTKVTESGVPDFVSAVVFDYDSNDLLDIFMFTDDGLKIIRNLGDFQFEEVEGFEFPEVQHVSEIKWVDIDGDNDNDFILMQSNFNSARSVDDKNVVLKNVNGQYVETAYEPLSNLQTFHLAIADLDYDGLFDLYHSDNGFCDNKLYVGDIDKHTLYPMTWATNESIDTSYPCQGYSSDVEFADFDNNGYLDILLYGNRLFYNLGNMQFVADYDHPLTDIDYWYDRMSSAAVDINDDGFLDIALGNGFYTDDDSYDSPNYLFINNKNENNWIKLECTGTKSNFDAIGTKVKLKASIGGEEIWQVRLIGSDAQIFSFAGNKQHFGLQKSEVVDSVVVYWTSGLVSVYKNLAANKTYRLVEPYLDYTGELVHCSNEPLIFVMPEDENITYDFFRNDTLLVSSFGNKVIADTAGDYYCVIHYDTWTDTTNTQTVGILPVDTTFVEIVPDSAYFCPGDSLEIFSPDYPKFNITWFDSSGIINGQNSASLIVNYVSGFYQVIENDYGCYDTSNIVSTMFYPTPELDLEEFRYFCPNDSVSFSVDSTLLNISWSNGANQHTAWFKNEGEYSVIAENIFGCAASTSFDVYEYPVGGLNMKSVYYFCHNDSVEVDLNNNFSSILWSNGETGRSSYFNKEGAENVKVTATYGCILEKEFKVQEVIITGLFDSAYSVSFLDTITLPDSIPLNNSIIWDDDLTEDYRRFICSQLSLGENIFYLTIKKGKCQLNDTLLLDVYFPDELAESEDVNTFPIPAGDELNIYIDEESMFGELTVKILDGKGTPVFYNTFRL